MALSYKNIAGLLTTSTNNWSKWFSYLGLGVGIFLLLCSLQLFINIQRLLNNDNPRKSGYDFISITKNVTNETMGTPEKNLFSAREIEDLKKQPFIDNAVPLLANQFRVQASAGNIIPFSTDLFLEALDNEFLDTIPPNFTWHPGQEVIPIIFSADFLEIYNVLAPGQGLPQVSEKTMASVNIFLTCYGPLGKTTFKASIVALTNRVNSVLVPKEFLLWANERFGIPNELNSRVFIKTKDANSPDFLKFLDEKDYKINKDKVKFGRVKNILQIVVSGLGLFGLLVVVLALMLFSFYLQLIIAKSRDNLQLLLTLGYAPKWLTKTVAGRWIPIYTGIVLVALILTAVFQYFFYRMTTAMETKITPFPHVSVIILAFALIIVTAYSNYRMIKGQLYKM
ncbi:MAG TPA: hypothetical protein VJT83_02050 [Chitinophagaceae bacterium]|nr:hypothetical protein [Chitinophagaceae bacterium]